jgi:hypothetical protein
MSDDHDWEDDWLELSDLKATDYKPISFDELEAAMAPLRMPPRQEFVVPWRIGDVRHGPGTQFLLRWQGIDYRFVIMSYEAIIDNEFIEKTTVAQVVGPALPDDMPVFELLKEPYLID